MVRMKFATCGGGLGGGGVPAAGIDGLRRKIREFRSILPHRAGI
jgi:hypothetical protein